MEWYSSIENLRDLASFIIDRDGEIDTVDFLEKPWKWDTEWKKMNATQTQEESLERLAKILEPNWKSTSQEIQEKI